LPALEARDSGTLSHMADLTLDGLLADVAGVLAAMTASEQLWLRQLRRLRLDRMDEPLPSATAPTRLSLVDPPDRYVSAPTHDLPDPEQGPPLIRLMAPSRAEWPETGTTSAVAPGADRRDYDYFAELDEKLARLRAQTMSTTPAPLS
jgi:hypothetical protein